MTTNVLLRHSPNEFHRRKVVKCLDLTAEEAEQLRLRIGSGRRFDLGTEHAGLAKHGVERKQTRQGAFYCTLIERLIAAHGAGQIPCVYQHVVTDQSADELLGRHRTKWAGHVLAQIAGAETSDELSLSAGPCCGNISVSSNLDRGAARKHSTDTAQVVGHMHHNIASGPVAARGLITPCARVGCAYSCVETLEKTCDPLNNFVAHPTIVDRCVHEGANFSGHGPIDPICMKSVATKAPCANLDADE